MQGYGQQCVKQIEVCDAWDDCDNGSDEARNECEQCASQPGRWLCLDRNERPKPHSLPPSDSALLSTLPGILLKRVSSAGKEFGRGSISGHFQCSYFSCLRDNLY